MGLFDYLKKNQTKGPHSKSDLSPAEKSLLAQISRINATGRNITPELYQQLREFEMLWLERHYDFNSIEGVNAIPVSKNIPGAPAPSSTIKGHTGEVYYYLRHKAYQHEETGNMELAIACMRKSVALAMCRDYFFPDDCYPLVRMLARAGHVDQARQQKNIFDKRFGVQDLNDMVEYEYHKYLDSCTVKWLQENFPNVAPKNVTGYRRMKTQNTKNYQKLKQLAADLGKEI